MIERLACSTAARQRGDDATATVARIDSWILVEFPGVWGRNPISDAALPTNVRKALLAALKAIPRGRLLFIRRRTENAPGCRVYVVRSTAPAAYTYVDVPSIDDVVTIPFAKLLAEANVQAPPLLLVCTHGQHDSCCGRRGYPLYDALRKHEGIDVWQCSHVGGDRFAGNAVVLPWGIFYGPVEPEQAETLVRSIFEEEIFLPSYRGRSTISRAAQAAETFLRRERQLLSRAAIDVLGREDLPENRVMVRLRDDRAIEHRVTVEQFVATEAAFATCGSSTAEPIQQFRVVAYESVEL